MTDSAAVALWSYFALAIGVSIKRGYLSESALEFAVAGFLLLWFAVLRAYRPRSSSPDKERHYELLYAGLLGLAFFQWRTDPAWHPVAPPYVEPCQQLGALGVVGVLLHALLPDRFRRVGLWVVMIAALVVWGLGVHYDPHPQIDLWQLQQGASDHLLHGRNPYSHAISNSSQGGMFGYRIDHYDYLPLNLLLGLPAYLLGRDYRYSLVACMFIIVVVIRVVGRRLQVAPRAVDLITMAFLLHPMHGFCMIQGWAEPMLLGAVALFVYFSVRAPGGVGQSVALFAVPMMKPYFMAPMLAFVPTLRPRWRSLLVATLAAAATVVPFLIWNFRATVEYGLLFTLQKIPFRADSLSIPAWLNQQYHWQCGKTPALVAQLATGAICFLLLRRRGLAGFLLLSATSLYASFLAGSQAFTNYYFFVGGLLILSALVLAAPPDEPAHAERSAKRGVEARPSTGSGRADTIDN